MAQTLESIKGGGGSIKVGAIGTIGALMTRELDSAMSSPQTPSSSRIRLQTAPVSVLCGATPRKVQVRRSLDEATSSANSKRANHPSPKVSKKPKGYNGSIRRVPMLDSDNISLDRTPSREKPIKKGPQLVDIVDIKCGDPHKSWVNPVANRLKKLRFAELSDTTV